MPRTGTLVACSAPAQSSRGAGTARDPRPRVGALPAAGGLLPAHAAPLQPPALHLRPVLQLPLAAVSDLGGHGGVPLSTTRPREAEEESPGSTRDRRQPWCWRKRCRLTPQESWGWGRHRPPAHPASPAQPAQPASPAQQHRRDRRAPGAYDRIRERRTTPTGSPRAPKQSAKCRRVRGIGTGIRLTPHRHQAVRPLIPGVEEVAQERLGIVRIPALERGVDRREITLALRTDVAQHGRRGTGRRRGPGRSHRSGTPPDAASKADGVVVDETAEASPDTPITTRRLGAGQVAATRARKVSRFVWPVWWMVRLLSPDR